MIARPLTGEYPPYFEKYISLVKEGDIFEILNEQKNNHINFLLELPAEKADYRYQPDKWSIKEVLNHITDTERIMSYRALRFARNDSQALPGYEQDDYVKYGNAAARTMEDLCEEFRLLRDSSIHMFRSFNEEMLLRAGQANKYQVTPRGILFMLAGHELHHIQIIKERYL